GQMSSLRAKLRRLTSFLGGNPTKPDGRRAVVDDDEPPANDGEQQLGSSPGTHTGQADCSGDSVDAVSGGTITTDDAQLPNEIIGSSDEWDGTSDLAWLLDERQDDAPENGVIADESVARAFDDLFGDWERR